VITSKLRQAAGIYGNLLNWAPPRMQLTTFYSKKKIIVKNVMCPAYLGYWRTSCKPNAWDEVVSILQFTGMIVLRIFHGL
jgi:hypothetical protein